MNSPPIYFEPEFLASQQALFSELSSSVKWDERMRARKTASFGVAYNYSQMLYAATPMPEQLLGIAKNIHRLVGFLPNNCLLNYYETGRSFMGFHSDSTEELSAGTGVAIVSLGSARSLIFRSKSDKNIELEYPLPSGSLIYLNKETQDHWLHAIPKTEEVGDRISLTFRSIII